MKVLLDYQQKLETSELAVVLMVVKDNRYETFQPLIPEVQQAIQKIRTGRLVRVEAQAT